MIVANRSLLFPSKIFFATFLVIGAAFFPSGLSAYNIAIVRDGPSWYFDELNQIFESELTKLTETRTPPTFSKIPAEPYNIASIRAAVNEALNNEAYDAVYTCGVIATEIIQGIATERGSLDKLVIAGSLQLSEAAPGIISDSGTSEIDNYLPIVTPKRVSTDLERLKSIANETEIYLVIDQIYIEALSSRFESGREVFAEALELSIIPIAASSDLNATLASIPEKARAVYVSILDRFDDTYRTRLYEGLNERGILTMAMNGLEDVEKGALLGLAQFDYNQIARRAALNLYLALSGTPTTRLPVYLPTQDRLVLNMATADAIAWAPDYDTALSAEVINMGTSLNRKPLTIEDAMQRARLASASVEIARRSAEISEAGVNVTRSLLLPQISASGSASHQRIYGLPGGSDQNYTDTGAIGLELRQILFNEEVWSGLNIQRDLFSASKMDLLSSELDATSAAASAYLACLSAEALYEIERSNLNLTYDTVQLARIRVDIGASKASELFRWEQQLARGKALLIQRESARLNAVIQLNRILGLPQSSEWDFEEITIGDREFYFLNDTLGPLLKNAVDFRSFISFTASQAIENSPELAAFDLQLQAQGIQLRSLKRDFYLPEISMSGGFSRNYLENAQTDWSGQNQASIGVQVSIPLFEGGGRFSEIRQQRATIARLEAQRLATVQSLEEAVLSANNGIRAGHPNICLNRQALTAAQANYDAINEQYAQGDASFLDLLDAQQALLSQQQTLNTATFDYLNSIYALQRSIAWFEHEKTPAERAAWINDFQNFRNSQP
ncbi:MAG: TolC family protein [Opitutales bacterium]|nr:TolC family protein [Opitutales bacterium]